MKNKNTLIIVVVLVVVLIGILVFLNSNGQQGNQSQEQEEANLTLEETITKDVLHVETDLETLTVEPKPFTEDQLSIINQINTSEDLINYINSNISITPKVDLLIKQPSVTLSDLEGNKSDVAVLINEIFRQKGMSSSVLLYTYTDGNQKQAEVIVPFRDVDEPRYIFFEDDKVNMKHHGWSYAEMFAAEESRTGRKMTEYCVMDVSTGYMKPIECSPREEEPRKHYFIEEDELNNE